jgi:hypothetical protein
MKKIIDFLESIRNFLLYFIVTKKRYINFLVGILLVVTVAILVYKTTNKSFDISNIESWWNAWGDPLLGLSTFLVAIVIWLTNTAMDWEDNLEKKLTIIYKHSLDNREVIRCEKAYLAHEGDIRNWGQSLGQQTIGNTKVRFLFNASKFDKVDKIEKLNNRYFKHYIATFYLVELPDSSLLSKDLGKGRYVWLSGKKKPKFEGDKIIMKNNQKGDDSIQS